MIGEESYKPNCVLDTIWVAKGEEEESEGAINPLHSAKTLRSQDGVEGQATGMVRGATKPDKITFIFKDYKKLVSLQIHSHQRVRFCIYAADDSETHIYAYFCV